MARPKGSTGKTNKASLREAWIEVVSKKPWLVKEAMERGLESGRPLGFLELGARLMKEIGAQEEQKTQIAIIFNGSLDAGKLRPGAETTFVLPSASQSHPQLPAPNSEVEVLADLTVEALTAEEAELLEAPR